jgi:hypothetical protein
LTRPDVIAAIEAAIKGGPEAIVDALTEVGVDLSGEEPQDSHQDEGREDEDDQPGHEREEGCPAKKGKGELQIVMIGAGPKMKGSKSDQMRDKATDKLMSGGYK